MRTRSFLCGCLALLLSAGCASSRVELKPPHPFGADMAGQQVSWHYLRFQGRWPAGRRPDWPLDLLIADRVLSGIITRHQDALPLWRFHRRAAPDAAGHQFSFIFYGSDRTAEAIQETAAGHEVTAQLLEAGFLEKIYTTSTDRASELSATSDPNWPAELQETWPMFIMGVSQTWLALVEIEAAGLGPPAGDITGEVRRYAEVNDEIDELWLRYAQHGFFHHLSGVFGYRPVLIQKHMRF